MAAVVSVIILVLGVLWWIGCQRKTGTLEQGNFKACVIRSLLLLIDFFNPTVLTLAIVAKSWILVRLHILISLTCVELYKVDH